MTDLDGRTAQAWGGTNPDGVHLNVVLARRGSPTAAAMTGAFASPTAGFTPILVCAGEDQPSYRTIHPPTIMLNKTESPTEALVNLVSGACQVGIAQGVLDSVADGVLAGDQETLVFAAVWLNPEATSGDAVRAAAREAMRKGVREAAQGHDFTAELVAGRDRVTHPFYAP
ncbi:formaldehyde-activating enzyme [Amycolatopsis sp. NBC_01480]|uniref:formaldehyde-activating enzyme n=1 Tax=Amycolatopsis sp. NBC_01480 TaxID=2903562 RepID=UPI002E2B5D2E|nr:formaldehyde-activating enzyme [Amycolatopsis sp. NBC_01480]